MAVPVRSRRMKTHPDGKVFFAENVDRQQNAAQIFAQVLRPVLADEVELARQ